MNKNLFRTLLLLLALLAPSVLIAAAPQPPDYSRAALLRILGDFYAHDETSWLDWQVGSRVRLHFAPVVLPVLYDSPRCDLMPPVSPSQLLNESFPATRTMVAVDSPNVATAIRQIENLHARAAPFE